MRTKTFLLISFIVGAALLVVACGATPTPTPVPPTPTRVPPTNTPVPPTATSVPPTATTVPPTATKPAAPTATIAAAPSPTQAQAKQPPTIPHPVQAGMDCLQCHGQGKVKPYPADHVGRTNEQCQTCHKPKS